MTFISFISSLFLFVPPTPDIPRFEKVLLLGNLPPFGLVNAARNASTKKKPSFLVCRTHLDLGSTSLLGVPVLTMDGHGIRG